MAGGRAAPGRDRGARPGLVAATADLPGVRRRPGPLGRPGVAAAVRRRADADGLGARGSLDAAAHLSFLPPPVATASSPASVSRNLARVSAGTVPKASQPIGGPGQGAARSRARRGRGHHALHGARLELHRRLRAADDLRRDVSGDTVTYVVTRNINYTNVCYFRCGFCAFSKGKLAANLRGRPYLVPIDEIVRRAKRRGSAARSRCASRAESTRASPAASTWTSAGPSRSALPDLHVHAFSPLEVWQGAATLGVGLAEYLVRLRGAGLASLPGTAAEILDDDVRAVICPDKVSTRQWLGVHEAAHLAGLRSTATIMFGHADTPGAGRATCSASASCRSAPAASPNSCRCRSCTWKRPCT